MTNKAPSCRNCGSNDWYSHEVYAKGAYGPDLLPVGSIFGRFSNPKFRIHVCGSCGLVEWFVPEEFLARVKEKWR